MTDKLSPLGDRPTSPLSSRIAWGMAVIVALAVAMLVAVSSFASRHWVVAQIDTDLQEELPRILNAPPLRSELNRALGQQSGADDQLPDGIPPQLEGAGYRDGSLLVRLTSSGLAEAGLIVDHSVQALTATQSTQIVDGATIDGVPRSIDISGLGSFRVIAVKTDTSYVVVGQSLDDADELTKRLIMFEVLLGAGVILATALLGRQWIRSSLLPLDRVANTARKVGHLDLVDGEIPPLDRVPQIDATPGTEIGDVGAALNTLIDNVEDAIGERQRSEDSLRRFSADASHELRTPLAAIRGYAQAMGDGTVDQETALARIQSESARMSALVEDMLLLARLDAGRELASEPVDIIPIAIESVADAHAATPDHTFDLDIPDDAAGEMIAQGDETAIRQIVLNLLSNARLHTPPGTHVTLKLRAADQSEDIRVTVADDGPGIPADVRDSLFDRFVRGDSSRARKKDGSGSTGLGLAIVASLAEAMDAHIALDTGTKGASFTVSFPRAKAPAQDV